MTHYDWWGAVPDHLVTKTTAAALDLPRTTKGVPVAARVTDRNGPVGRETYDLFDVTQCPPTATTARQLAARAETRGQAYRCADCGAHTERPVLETERTGAGACLACRHIARIRGTQAWLATERDLIAIDLAAVLNGPPAVIVQVDQHIPPPTDSGRARPATAIRVRVGDLEGTLLADVTVRLVGPRARWVPDDAVDVETAGPRLAAVLDDQRLVAWSAAELDQLHDAGPGYPPARAADAWTASYPDPATYYGGVGAAEQYRAWLASERRDTAHPVLLATPPTRCCSRRRPPAGAACSTRSPASWSTRCRPAVPTGPRC